MQRIDTLTASVVERVGIFHDLADGDVHTFDLDYIELVLNYCLDSNYLVIFGIDQRVSNQKNKWILRHNYKFKILDLVPENIKNIKNKKNMKNLDRQEYLVFKCPCNECDEIIFFDDIIERYIDKDSDLYKKLNKKIKTKMIQIYDNIFSRVIYCPNKKCKNSSGIIIKKKIDTIEKHLICNLCSTDWCSNCKTSPYHIGEKCSLVNFFKTMETDRESIKFILENCMVCSICNMAIMKKGGCDHIFCSVCKRSSCWMCGEIMENDGYYTRDIDNKKKHIIRDRELDTWVCRNVYKKNRDEHLKSLRIKTLKKIYGSKMTDDICENFLEKLYDVAN